MLYLPYKLQIYQRKTNLIKGYDFVQVQDISHCWSFHNLSVNNILVPLNFFIFWNCLHPVYLSISSDASKTGCNWWNALSAKMYGSWRPIAFLPQVPHKKLAAVGSTGRTVLAVQAQALLQVLFIIFRLRTGVTQSSVYADFITASVLKRVKSISNKLAVPVGKPNLFGSAWLVPPREHVARLLARGTSEILATRYKSVIPRRHRQYRSHDLSREMTWPINGYLACYVTRLGNFAK